jgi:pimeloyl-ACP methyl ester carboxylesterase
MIKKIIKRILIGIVGVLVLVSLIICVLYIIDKNKRLSELESNSQLAETSVGTIEYKIYGDKGPLILIMHGSGSGYDYAIPFEGYRRMVPSRPGYLRTPLQVGETPAEQAKAFSALLDFLGIEKVIVWGGSGGGPAAISFAALFPEKTLGLGLSAAVSQESVEVKMPSFRKSDFVMWIIFSMMENDNFLRTFLKSSGLIQDKANEKLILEDPKKIEVFKKLMWGTWPPSQRIIGMQNDFKPMKPLNLPVSEVIAPTLIIHGSNDNIVPVEQSKKLFEQISGSQLEIIEGAGHLVMISHHDEIIKIMDNFFKD